MKLFFKLTLAEIISIMMRIIKIRIDEQEDEGYEEPYLMRLVLESEDSDSSIDSGLGDIAGSSSYCSRLISGASTSTPSGYPAPSVFNRAPGPSRSRPKNDSEGDRTNHRKWGPIGIDDSNPPLPITREGSLSPWDGCHWTPFKKYHWHPMDKSPYSFSLYDKNNSYYSRNDMAPSTRQLDNYRPASQCSEFSSSASTLETSWSSTDEEEVAEEPIPFPKVSPVVPHWLVGYLKTRGIGFLMAPEVNKRMQSWQLARDAIPPLAPCDEVDDTDEKSKEQDEEEE